MAFTEILLAAAIVFAATTAGGAAIALFKGVKRRTYSALIAFSAGMMAFSAAEMLFAAHVQAGDAALVFGLALGVAALFLVEKSLPHLHLLLRKRKIEESKKKAALLAGTITIHNVPEGLAIASAFAGSPGLGWLVTTAMALQDAPEGFLVSAPLSFYGLKAGRAFKFAALSGFAEAAAAVVGFAFLSFAVALTPIALAFSAGAMGYVILVELLPDAFQKGFERGAALSFAAGIVLAFALASVIRI